jgi:FixJ family two-component response regulator
MATEPTVFIVDDDEAVRDSLMALLDAVGLKVEAFGSAKEFLSAYDAGRTGCLVLDVRMPGMSGLELQRKLAASQFPIPVVIITGHGDVPMAVEAMKAGAVDFIEKPFRQEVLLDSIRRSLETGGQERHGEFAAAEVAARIALLTPRETEVLKRLVIGQPNKVIAFGLGISPRTVEIHRARVMEKMQARSLSHLVRMALAAGIDADSA